MIETAYIMVDHHLGNTPRQKGRRFRCGETTPPQCRESTHVVERGIFGLLL